MSVLLIDMVLAGRLHPLLVHFPIGLVLVAAGAELLAILMRQPVSSAVAQANIRVGAALAAAAAVAGWLLARQPDFEASRALEWHRWLAVAATSGAILTAAATVVAKRSPAALWIYRALLLTSAAAVAVTGHLGGSLVWGADFLHF